MIVEDCERHYVIPARGGKPAIFYTKDFLDVGDVQMLWPGEPRTLLVQATSLSNFSSHLKKALEAPKLPNWLLCGHTFEIWAWFRKQGSTHYEFTRTPIVLVDGRLVVGADSLCRWA